MTHITCDHCGKQLHSGQDHYVVKIEVFAAHDPAEITEEDLDTDHMEAVSELLQELTDSDDAEVRDSAPHYVRYDLCPDCRKRFLRDPLRKDSKQKFDFSEN